MADWSRFCEAAAGSRSGNLYTKINPPIPRINLVKKLTAGIPSKKPKFRLAEKTCDYASCILDGSNLYIWYERRAYNGLEFSFKKYNLDEFTTETPINYESGESIKACSDAYMYGDYILLQGGVNAVFAKNTEKVEYIESKLEADKNNWPEYQCGFMLAGQYYRNTGKSETGATTYDIVSMAEGGAIIGKLELPFNVSHNFGDDVLVGVHDDSTIYAYSVRKQVFLFSPICLLDRGEVAEYRESRAAFAEHSFCVLADDTVFIIDIDEGKKTNNFCFRDNQSVISTLKLADIKIEEFYPHAIEFDESVILLIARVGMLCLEAGSGNCLWARAVDRMDSAHIAADLIFGSATMLPIAWDKYSGEQVWESAIRIPCLQIQVGGRWVVYHQVCGHLACYQWKKPYLSPHCPH